MHTNNKKLPVYHLSNIQNSMYFLNKLKPGSSYYNMGYNYNIYGDFSVPIFKKSIRALIDRHELLRANIVEVDGIPGLIINSPNDRKYRVDVYDLTKIKSIEKRKKYEKNIIDKRIRPAFDLKTDSLIRLVLFKKEIKRSQKIEYYHSLYIAAHHIIFDGYSMNIFLRDFELIYNALTNKQRPLLGSNSLQYKDYAYQEQSLEFKIRLRQQENFWLKKLSDYPRLLSLPFDKERPPVPTYQGGVESIPLDTKSIAQIKNLCKDINVSEFTFFFSVFIILLHKLTGQHNIILGIPWINRNDENKKSIIGCFINTLAIRSLINEKDSFFDLIKKVDNNLKLSHKNGEYPLGALVKKLNPERHINQSPLFNVFFQMSDGAAKPSKAMNSLIIKSVPLNLTTAQFDIKVNIDIMDKSVKIDFNYSSDIFIPRTTKRWLGFYEVLIKNTLRNPGEQICDLEIISLPEKQKLLYGFNNTKAKYPKQKTIHQLFEEQVKRTPNHVAIKYAKEVLTYKQLNIRANRLAHYLRGDYKVKPDDIIAIMLPRSPEMIIAILAVLKAGAAYLPIDPEYPGERIKYALKDSQAKVLIYGGYKNNAREIKKLRNWEIGKLKINIKNRKLFEGCPKTNPEPIAKPKSLTYVIYTSGSTGKPKGVMVEHQSAVNRLYWMQKEYPLNKNDVILQKTNYTFDVSVWEVCLWFFSGASVSLLSPGDERSPAAICENIYKGKITTVHFVPSMLAYFLDYIKTNPQVKKKLVSLRYVFSSGENLSWDLARKFYALFKNNNTKLVNFYGPTEAAIDVTHYPINFKHVPGHVPIGKSIANTGVYVLDRSMNLLPPGIPGELYISGDCLARGYLNDPKKTKEVFLPYPHNKLDPRFHGNRIYKTGDRAKMHVDGNIEILGRVDMQVKIRGQRVELGEIEAQIKKIQGIKETVITVLDKNFHKPGEIKKVSSPDKDKLLAAYFTAQGKIDINKLRSILKEKLPDYMIPAYIVKLNDMPLTASGKIDRAKLRIPDEKDMQKARYEPPRTEIEKRLVKIWQEVLDLKKISINDSFFKLGGHSLKAIQAQSKINKNFKIDFSLQNIFRYFILEEQASIINEMIIGENIIINE